MISTLKFSGRSATSYNGSRYTVKIDRSGGIIRSMEYSIITSGHVGSSRPHIRRSRVEIAGKVEPIGSTAQSNFLAYLSELGAYIACGDNGNAIITLFEFITKFGSRDEDCALRTKDIVRDVWLVYQDEDHTLPVYIPLTGNGSGSAPDADRLAKIKPMV